MAAIAHNSKEAALLQSEIHQELMRRGTVEADDQTMAEYVTVLCINEKPMDEIGQELADIGGAEFDASFLGWLADRLAAIQSGTTSFAAAAVEAPHPVQEVLPVESVAAARPIRAESSSSRLLSNALAPLASDQSRGGPSTTAGQKRGLSPDARDNINKRRSLGTGGVPTAPKALRGEDDGDVRMDGDEEERRRQRPAGQRNGRPSLLDRMGGPPNGSVVDSTGVDRPVRNIRGRGGRMDRAFGPGMGRMTPAEMQMQAQLMAMQQQHALNMQRGFPPAMMDPMMMQGMFMKQQEQLAQMQQMMEHMTQVVQHGGVAPVNVRPRPPTAQPAQKLGDHTISARQGVPAASSKAKEPVPIPDHPLSPDLCKYGVGCTNVRCVYSHPSPVATESTGIVLKTDPCPQGKACKDVDCPYSHVSPAQVLGEVGAERRVLCKFPVCTNPSCQFRHEDANGNPIPPPALTRALNKPKKENGNEVDMDADDWELQVGEETATGLGAGPARSESDTKMQLDSALGDGKKPAVAKPLNGTISTPCRFGLSCTNKFCKFTHPVDAPCRYGVRCFKEDCPYSHPPGRKVNSIFPQNPHKNKSTSFNPSAPAFRPGQHISQRKFVDESQPVTKLVPGEGEPQIDVVVASEADMSTTGA